MYLALRDLLVARGRFALVGAVIALVSLLAGAEGLITMQIRPRRHYEA